MKPKDAFLLAGRSIGGLIFFVASPFLLLLVFLLDTWPVSALIVLLYFLLR